MNVIVIRALADSVLEGDERFSIHLFPAQSGAVIDPLNGESFSNPATTWADNNTLHHNYMVMNQVIISFFHITFSFPVCDMLLQA